jgi:MOSC domain-containing protein YiiM
MPPNSSVVSINVGTPRTIETRNGPVSTAIFKEPVTGRIAIHGHNLEGDRQADPRVHGGPYKAVYAYPSEHYAYWAEQLGGFETQKFGLFGENLTTAGLDEDEIRIGDQFRIGSALLQVTQPRMPCYKLALRWERTDMVKRFWRSGRPGFYLSVVEEGSVGAGDAIELVKPGPEQVTVGDVVRLYQGLDRDETKLQLALQTPLRGSWKQELRERWSSLLEP